MRPSLQPPSIRHHALCVGRLAPTLGTALLLALLIVTPLTVGTAMATDQPAAPRHIKGIDVSHHSGAIDWPTVIAQDVDFVYLKATEGNDAGDPMFLAHWQALGELGVPRGAYHFYVTEDAPETQATFFLDTLRQAGVGPGDLVPVVDVELIGHGTEPGLAERVHRFVQLVEEGLGVAPAIYTSPNFWDAHMVERVDDGFGERHHLWVAEYQVDRPELPRGWRDWTLWQWEGDAEVAGVEKGADVSWLHERVGLDALRIPAPQSEDVVVEDVAIDDQTNDTAPDSEIPKHQDPEENHR